jgi:hypothetical protein
MIHFGMEFRIYHVGWKKAGTAWEINRSAGVAGFGLLSAFRPRPFLFTARFAQDAKGAK